MYLASEKLLSVVIACVCVCVSVSVLSVFIQLICLIDSLFTNFICLVSLLMSFAASTWAASVLWLCIYLSGQRRRRCRAFKYTHVALYIYMYIPFHLYREKESRLKFIWFASRSRAKGYKRRLKVAYLSLLLLSPCFPTLCYSNVEVTRYLNLLIPTWDIERGRGRLRTCCQGNLPKLCQVLLAPNVTRENFVTSVFDIEENQVE